MTEEPGELQSVGSQRLGHDGGTNTFTFMYIPKYTYMCLCSGLYILSDSSRTCVYTFIDTYIFIYIYIQGKRMISRCGNVNSW